MRTATNQGDDLVGTQKSVPVDEPDDFLVAFRQLDWRNFGNATKAWKSGHFSTMSETRKMVKTRDFARCGNQAVKPECSAGKHLIEH